jgi:hypothetical protein
MTHAQLDAMLADSGFDPDDVEQLTAVLAPMAELADEAPAPSPELLALFGETAPRGGEEDEAARVVPLGRSRNRGVVAGALVLALSGVGATGLSAAANTLPSPLQHQVSDFSRHYLPFDFPEPTVRIAHLARPPRTVAPEPGAGARGPAATPTAAELQRRTQEISRSLTGGRPGAKAAPARSAHRHQKSRRDAYYATYATPRTAGPSASPSASPSAEDSSSPTTRPSGSQGGGKPSTAKPVKTVGPHAQHSPHAGPGGEPRPTYGPDPGGPKKDGGPQEGGPGTDPDRGARNPIQNPIQNPDPVVPVPDPPDLGVPVDGGPALDRVTPDVVSDALNN